MTEQTAIINGVTLTETQLWDGLAQIEAAKRRPLEAGEQFQVGGKGRVWRVLNRKQAVQWWTGRGSGSVCPPLIAMDTAGCLLQFYAYELSLLVRVQQ